MSVKRFGHLGKLPFRPDHRDLKALHLVGAPLPIAPSSCSWEGPTPDTDWLLNDRFGCCTCSAAVHIIRQLTEVSIGTQAGIGDQAVYETYQAACGYVPGKPETDQGGYLRDVLKYWRQTGIAGHRLAGYGLIPAGSPMAHIKVCHALFGAIYVGAGLPRAAQYQDVWDVPEGQALTGDYEPWSWGGHAMNTIAYGRGWVDLETWGSRQRVTERWYRTYADESWVPFAPQDWIAPGAIGAPNQFLREELERALASL